MSVPPLWVSRPSIITSSKIIMLPQNNSRFFSTNMQLNRQVRMRREMFKWINRVGKNLKDPLHNSTNYLSAYSVSGNLRGVEERTVEHLRKVEEIKTLIKERPDIKEEKQIELNRLEEQYSLESKILPAPTRRDMMPFPANKDFISEPVLGPWLQNEIWADVMNRGLTVREVSSLRGVEMGRVAAVVRLLEVEKSWKEKGKEIADSYAETLVDMLPYTGKTALLNWSDEDEQALNDAKLDAKMKAQREVKEREDENIKRKTASLPPLPPAQPKIPDEIDLKRNIIENRRRSPHESINDLPVLKITGAQLWLPVSESRRFTRADAAKAFDSNLQPADKRVPHPELTQMHKEYLAGKTLEERAILQDQRAELERRKILQRRANEMKRENSIKKVTNKRGIIFRFHEINVNSIEKDGRGTKGVGCRYGVPSMDRSKGDVKIPQHALVPPRHMPVYKYRNFQRA
ncbi:putative tyrosine phosphatase protein [Erysiphe necator]|uniref:Putative tyrosine phosphatase protein n=1 Tax=Uncinula necator TaxID=52586 RepID=A0A0B1P1Q2_UNCNE|nr:putative tyrosine phosphatase protein [Erysiphe necator]